MHTHDTHSLFNPWCAWVAQGVTVVCLFACLSVSHLNFIHILRMFFNNGRISKFSLHVVCLTEVSHCQVPLCIPGCV